MRHDSDGPYNWIGHFMDHFSKFHVLFPLENKRVQTVATALRQYVFYILQSDNGREFINSILEDLVELWPGETKIISGKARHPQSQGLVEQGNFTIELMVSARKETTQTINGHLGFQIFSVSTLCTPQRIHCISYVQSRNLI